MGLSKSGDTMIDVGGVTKLTISGNQGAVTWTPKSEPNNVATLIDKSLDGTTASVKGQTGGTAQWSLADEMGNTLDIIVHVGVVLIYGDDGTLYSLSPKTWQESKVTVIPPQVPSHAEMKNKNQVGVYVSNLATSPVDPVSGQWTTCYVLDLGNISIPPNGDE